MRTKQQNHEAYMRRRAAYAAYHQKRRAEGYKQIYRNKWEGPLPRSGCCGVTFNRNLSKWQVSYRGKFLGYFINKEEAIAARKAAEANEENHAKS